MGSMRDAFLAGLPAADVEGFAGIADLDELLCAVLEDARARWPAVVLDGTAFAGWIAERVDATRPLSEALGALRTEELYLACACARGDAQAIVAFERTFVPGIRSTLVTFAPSIPVDDVVQEVMTKLFVASERGPASIARYAGRGDLGAWSQVLAVRHAINRAQKKHPTPSADIEALAEQAAVAVPGGDLAPLKSVYGERFRRAFATAFGTLAVRERNLLRQEYLDGLGLEALATLHGVHRATVARWRARALARLLRETRRVLAADLEASRREIDSVMRFARSELDVSLMRLLGGADLESGAPNGEPPRD
jgi:RNA polymerase sigma-70 factor (ECF subfamily)